MKKNLPNDHDVWAEVDDRTGYLYDEMLLTQERQDELSRLVQQQIRMLARGLMDVFDILDDIRVRLKTQTVNSAA